VPDEFVMIRFNNVGYIVHISENILNVISYILEQDGHNINKTDINLYNTYCDEFNIKNIESMGEYRGTNYIIELTTIIVDKPCLI
jgi:predicted patatin/cPLA2 family phospholipase